MTIKEKKENNVVFIKLLVVSLIVLCFSIGLTYLGIHFADLAGLAKAKSMSEAFYAIGALVVGFFCLLAYAGSFGTFGFTLFLWFKPELDETTK